MPSSPPTQKHVIILRHAQAESHALAGRDFDRPLTQNGLALAKALGETWAQEGYRPELVMTSPARRTLETLQALEEGLGRGSLEVKTEPGFYLGGHQEMMLAVAQLDRDYDRLLLLGHNPGWSEALAYLSGQYIGMQTGQAIELVPVDLNHDWMTILASPGSCQLGRIWL